MRRLFREVRIIFEATTAIQLYDQSNTEIVKSDKRMRDAGITNGTRLRVSIHSSNPEVYTLFVALLNGEPKKINFAEVIKYSCTYAWL